MLDDPLTVKALIIINTFTVGPLIILGIKAVWNLSRIIERVDKMWIAYEREREEALIGQKRRLEDTHD
jgi:hypothetical protein